MLGLKAVKRAGKICVVTPRYVWRCKTDKNDIPPGSVQLFKGKTLLPSGLNAGTTKEAGEIDEDRSVEPSTAFMGFQNA